MECSLRAEGCTNSIKAWMNVKWSSAPPLFGDYKSSVLIMMRINKWVMAYSSLRMSLWWWSCLDLILRPLHGAISGKFSQITQVMFVPDSSSSSGDLKLPQSLFDQNTQFSVFYIYFRKPQTSSPAPSLLYTRQSPCWIRIKQKKQVYQEAAAAILGLQILLFQLQLQNQQSKEDGNQ